MSTSMRDLFDSRYEAVPWSGCWIWTGATSVGYGYIKRVERREYAHRLSYERFVGPIPRGLHVCHRCDNPLCVNPAHLFLGTARANSDDKVSKGRQARGESVSSCKLTPDEVCQIRADSRPQRSIAASFGISQRTVSCIKRRETWMHV